MTKKHKIIFTGITGAVGSWIAAEALKRGHTILAIMRDKNPENARERIGDILNITDIDKYYDNIDVIKGNICDDLLSITEKPEIKDVSMVFHCAAATEFSDANAEQSMQVNVKGTRNILELTGKLRIPLCYISTAYIAGRRQGEVKENEIDLGQDFNNIYEKTKCKAECLVQEWIEETDVPIFIFRPGIVIGDSKKGRLATFNGIYNILRFFDAVESLVKNEHIRAIGNKDATKNLIPVDYLAKVVWYIIERGITGTYHITNPNPVTMEQLRNIYIDLFGLNGELVTQEEYQSKEPTRLELLFQKASSLYAPYMVNEPVFDRSNTDAALYDTNIELPVIDTDYFKRLLKYAKSVEWGKSKSKLSKLSGRSLTVVEKYFDDFLAGKMNKQLLPDLRKLSAAFRIVLKEKPDTHWTLAINQGILTKVSKNGEVYECSFVVDRNIFAEITSGRIAPQQAFFKKQVDIEGNIETGLKLVTVLASFFRKYPYNTKVLND
jgi:nucleoside-diphosphate-sugar epimerase/putative sterol carrier protein